jgi:shikimate dehydrogenase
LIHAEFARQAGLSIHYERCLVPIEPGSFARAIAELRSQGIYGCNVTLPFKEQAYALAQVHSEAAERVKAANTLIFNKEGLLYADNTDGIGLVRDIQNNLAYSLRNKRILICGAGGAARGILYPIMQQHPANIVIANRGVDRAISLAKEFSGLIQIQAESYRDLADREFDVIIEATSALTETLPLPDSLMLSSNSLCYDLKYKTPSNADLQFLAWAKDKRAKIATDGLGMLVEQAAESFKIWTGFMPETEPVIKKLLIETLS